jgi:predicted nucleic acid-binding protein
LEVFVDTSALLDFVDVAGPHHDAAVAAWERMIADGDRLMTTNYVLAEAMAAFQTRLGMAAVRDLVRQIAPAVEIVWVDRETHHAAAEVVLSANRRQLSFVDCVSFAVMSHLGIHCAFTLDSHFRDQGFDCLP